MYRGRRCEPDLSRSRFEGRLYRPPSKARVAMCVASRLSRVLECLAFGSGGEKRALIVLIRTWALRLVYAVPPSFEIPARPSRPSFNSRSLPCLAPGRLLLPSSFLDPSPPPSEPSGLLPPQLFVRRQLVSILDVRWCAVDGARLPAGYGSRSCRTETRTRRGVGAPSRQGSSQ